MAGINLKLLDYKNISHTVMMDKACKFSYKIHMCRDIYYYYIICEQRTQGHRQEIYLATLTEYQHQNIRQPYKGSRAIKRKQHLHIIYIYISQ